MQWGKKVFSQPREGATQNSSSRFKLDDFSFNQEVLFWVDSPGSLLDHPYGPGLAEAGGTQSYTAGLESLSAQPLTDGSLVPLVPALCRSFVGSGIFDLLSADPFDPSG